MEATPNSLNSGACSQIADLHCRCLPDSLITRMGPRYVASFYGYVDRSEHEFAFVQWLGSQIVSVCVVSEAPDSLESRLLRHTPLLPWLCLRWYRLPILSILKSKLTRAPVAGQRKELSASIPELLLIYTAAEQRGSGLGSVVLGRCEAFLASRGWPEYTIKTIDDGGNRALAFYARNGFAMQRRVVKQGRRFQVWKKSLC